MAEIISLRDDPHRNVELLIPWYGSGQISPDDAAQVEAHLADCAQCQVVLEQDRRLKAAIGNLPVSADLGWEKLQRRLAPDRPLREYPRRRTFTLNWPVAVAAFAGVQLALLTTTFLFFRPAAPSASYQTLAAPTLAIPGNLIVLFRPETTEQELRQTLAEAGARLVDGPTATGAYILAVDPARRDAVLAGLRTRSTILLVQPVDRADAR